MTQHGSRAYGVHIWPDNNPFITGNLIETNSWLETDLVTLSLVPLLINWTNHSLRKPVGTVKPSYIIARHSQCQEEYQEIELIWFMHHSGSTPWSLAPGVLIFCWYWLKSSSKISILFTDERLLGANSIPSVSSGSFGKQILRQI